MLLIYRSMRAVSSTGHMIGKQSEIESRNPLRLYHQSLKGPERACKPSPNHDFPCSRLSVLYLKIPSADFYSPYWLLVSVPFDFPKEEVKVLKFWRDIDAFQTSLKLSEGRPEYTFYDGPPFATGLPHYGHLLAGTIKVCTRCDCANRTTYPLTHFISRI